MRRTPDAGRYVLTDAIAGGPAMFDTARLDRAGGPKDTDPDPRARPPRRATHRQPRRSPLHLKAWPLTRDLPEITPVRNVINQSPIAACGYRRTPWSPKRHKGLNAWALAATNAINGMTAPRREMILDHIVQHTLDLPGSYWLIGRGACHIRLLIGGADGHLPSGGGTQGDDRRLERASATILVFECGDALLPLRVWLPQLQKPALRK